MVPLLWIKECLDLFGVPENIKTFLVNSMEKCTVMLCAGNSALGEVDIKQGIFQGSYLLIYIYIYIFSVDPINFDLRKDKGAHEFSGSKE